MKKWIPLVLWVALCELAGVVGMLFTTPALPLWYATLQKPAVVPPDWVFAPVWIALYLLMGIAAFLVWRHGALLRGRLALVAFGLQLVLNVLWSALFFGLHSPAFGLVGIVALMLAIALTIKLFARISAPAAWLLVPYLAWVCFAAYLNLTIWLLN